jgi:hypothetical protein
VLIEEAKNLKLAMEKRPISVMNFHGSVGKYFMNWLWLSCPILVPSYSEMGKIKNLKRFIQGWARNQSGIYMKRSVCKTIEVLDLKANASKRFGARCHKTCC